MLRGILCGVGGGLLGVAVWAAVAHFAGNQAGWAAWIMGICVGVGVQFGVQPRANFFSGVLAVPITVATIFVGTIVAREFATGQSVEQTRETMSAASDRTAVQFFKEDVAREFEKQGLVARGGTDGYSHEVIEEARRRWAGMGPTQRELFRSRLSENLSQQAGVASHTSTIQSFTSGLSRLDMLWIGLALVSAWRVASLPGRPVFVDEVAKEAAEASKRNNPILRGTPSSAGRPSSAPSPMRATSRPTPVPVDPQQAPETSRRAAA